MHISTDHTRFELLAVVTQRLVLLPVTESDAMSIVKWRNNRGNLEQFWSATGPSYAEQIEWTRSARSDRADYVIWHRDDRIRIGTVSVAGIQDEPLIGTKGTLIGEEQYRHLGIATEANEGWLSYLFSVLQFDGLEAYIRHENEGSIRLNTSVGLVSDRKGRSRIHPTRGAFKRFTISRREYLSRHKTYDLGKCVSYVSVGCGRGMVEPVRAT